MYNSLSMGVINKKAKTSLDGTVQTGTEKHNIQQLNFDSPCVADWLVLCKTGSSTGLPQPAAAFGSHQATAEEPGGLSRPVSRENISLSRDACCTSGPDGSLPNRKLIAFMQMIAALLDCHRCRQQSPCREGGWSTLPAPFLPRGMAWGDRVLGGTGSCLGCRQRHRRSLVSNASREQECNRHRLCLPGLQPFPCSRCFPGRLHVQSAPFGTAKRHFCFATLCACILTHIFQYFYCETAGLLAWEGGDRARTLCVGWGKCRCLILFRCHLCFAGRDRGKGSDSLADEQ